MVFGGALTLPGPARAQQTGRTYRLGVLTNGLRSEPYNLAFFQRLSELGFAEGRNLVIEFRAAQGQVQKLPEFAAELARLSCDVLVAAGSEAQLIALKQSTRDTPIVAVAVDYDPFATGHVTSLARPGGRITGISQFQSELSAKRLELLKELLPHARRIAVLADTGTGGQLAVVQYAAKRLGLELQVLAFNSQPYDYESAFAQAARTKAEALLGLVSGNFVPARRRIIELALQFHLPSMFNQSLWAELGGLLAYGPNFVTTFRRAAEQAAMIFNGKNPAEMPVEQPTRFELVINLKTAKALGLAIPQSMLSRADRVIE